MARAKVTLTREFIRNNPQVREWLTALKTLDIGWAKAQLPEDCTHNMSHDALLTGLHKARYENCYLEPIYRHKSREWLESNGHNRMNGEPWPPEGVLP